MRLTVNGERKETSATRVRALLDELDYAGTHLAIAVNHEVVPAPAGPTPCSTTATASKSSPPGRVASS